LRLSKEIHLLLATHVPPAPAWPILTVVNELQLVAAGPKSVVASKFSQNEIPLSVILKEPGHLDSEKKRHVQSKV
jgi:hypothetical protein